MVTEIDIIFSVIFTEKIKRDKQKLNNSQKSYLYFIWETLSFIPDKSNGVVGKGEKSSRRENVRLYQIGIQISQI